MEYREVEQLTTQTDEVFYLGDNQTYWHQVYIKERPELMPYKCCENVETKTRNSKRTIIIGPNIFKECSIDKDSCKSHEYDYISTLAETILPGKVFYINQFCNDTYYIEEDFINKYKELKGLVFGKKYYVVHDMSNFIKISEGMYRSMKHEFYVYVARSYVYIVNTDSLYQWKIYKEKFHFNEEFCLRHVFEVPVMTTELGYRYEDKLLPLYSQEEVIRITTGIYRTRNIIPDKIKKKYMQYPTWHIDPILTSNKEDYVLNNPEFLCFKTLSNDHYLVNIDKVDEWQKMVEEKKEKYSYRFLYKKFLYSVQPYEYQLIKKGIYSRTKSVDPYIDSPPK